MKKWLFFLSFLFLSLSGYCQIITTIAGNGTPGYSGDNGLAVNAELHDPTAIAVDRSGNVYIADRENNRVRKITSGIITTIAGTDSAGFSGDGGQATDAKLSEPDGLAVDKAGNIYVADLLNNGVRKINTSGIISTYAGIGAVGGYSGDGGPATLAKLVSPAALAVDKWGNLYITQAANSVVRKVNTAGIISTVAGDGVSTMGMDGVLATNTPLDGPLGVAVDTLGNIFITDDNSSLVRKVDTAGYISTVAGNGTPGFSGDDGPATDAELSLLWGIGIDNWNNIYFCDAGNGRIRKINPEGIITTIAGGGTTSLGDGGLAINCSLNSPSGVAIDNYGNIYIADFSNNRIRHITSTVSIKPLNNLQNNFAISPNPSNGDFEINIYSNNEAQIVITDALGCKVEEFFTHGNKPFNVTLDVPAGVYFVIATIQKEKMSEKIIVIK